MKFQKKVLAAYVAVIGFSADAYAGFFHLPSFNVGICRVSGPGAKCQSKEAALQCLRMEHAHEYSNLMGVTQRANGQVRLTVSDRSKENFRSMTNFIWFSMTPINPNSRGDSFYTSDANCLSHLHNSILEYRNGVLEFGQDMGDQQALNRDTYYSTNSGVCQISGPFAQCKTPRAAVRCLQMELNDASIIKKTNNNSFSNNINNMYPDNRESSQGASYMSNSRVKKEFGDVMNMISGKGAVVRIGEKIKSGFLYGYKASVAISSAQNSTSNQWVSFETVNPNCLSQLNNKVIYIDQHGATQVEDSQNYTAPQQYQYSPNNQYQTQQYSPGARYPQNQR